MVMMIQPRRWNLLLITASYCCLSSIGLAVLLSQVGFVTFAAAGTAAASAGSTIGATPPLRFHDDDNRRRRRHLTQYWNEEEEQWEEEEEKEKKKSDDRIKSWKSGDYYDDYYDENENEDQYHEEDKFKEDEENDYGEFKDEEEEEEEDPEPPTKVLDGGDTISTTTTVSKGGSGSIGIENGNSKNNDGDGTGETDGDGEEESDDVEQTTISIDFKPVLLTFLFPSHRVPTQNNNNNNNNNRHMILLRRRLEEAAFANFDRAEFTALTSSHVLSELTRESDVVRDVNLVVSPIQTQTSGESSASSAAAADAAPMTTISVAIDGSVVVPSTVVKRATGSSVRAENVQNMVESAFRGESLKRYIRRLHIYSVDPNLRNVQNIYMGLPSDISAANTGSSNQPTNNDSEGYSNVILIVVGVMGGIALMLICCSVIYLCRRNIVQRRAKFASSSLDEDHSSIPTSDGREEKDRANSGPNNDMSSVQSYQQSEVMSIYVESNIADQSHFSIEPRTAQKNSPVAARNEQNSSAGAQTSSSTGDFAAVEPFHQPPSPDPRSESEQEPGRHSGDCATSLLRNDIGNNGRHEQLQQPITPALYNDTEIHC